MSDDVFTVDDLDPDDPRVLRGPSKARRFDALTDALDMLMAAWNRSTNPVLRSAAGQLRAEIGRAESSAQNEHLARLAAQSVHDLRSGRTAIIAGHETAPTS